MSVQPRGQKHQQGEKDDRHRGGISCALPRRATTALAFVAVISGCGGGTSRGTDSGTPTVTVTRLVERDSLIVLEAGGAVPADTSLMVARGEPRVIILRHGPPDDVVFAELSLPANAFGPSDGDSVLVSLTPLPGIYGLDLAADAPIRPGAQLIFKYSVHFASPREARRRYATDVAFEEALFIGRLLDDGRVAELPSSRPASDNLRAILPADGAYVVAAPR